MEWMDVSKVHQPACVFAAFCYVVIEQNNTNCPLYCYVNVNLKKKIYTCMCLRHSVYVVIEQNNTSCLLYCYVNVNLYSYVAAK